MIDNFYKKYVSSLKNEYLILGALMLLFALLNEAFGSEKISSVLLGTVLFGITIVLYITSFRIFILQIDSNKSSLSDLIYPIIHHLFVLTFFIAGYQKYPSIFNSLFGIVFGLIPVILVAEFRVLVNIINYKNNINNKVIKLLFKKSLRFMLLVIYLILWFLITKYVSQYLDIEVLSSKKNVLDYTNEELFFQPILWFSTVSVVVGWIVGIIDLFKEPKGKHAPKELRLIKSIKFIKDSIISKK